MQNRQRDTDIQNRLLDSGRRQGWDVSREQHWNMYIIYGETDHQPRLDAWDKCSGLVHREDPEGTGREGGGRGDQDGEYIYIHGWFMSMYDKNHYSIVISLQLIQVNEKKKITHPLSWWCHPAISSSVVPFSTRLQSFPASGFFQMNQFFTSGGQSTGVWASASVLSMNIQDSFPLGNGWISLQSKGLSRVFSNTTDQKHQFFSTQLSFWSNSHIHTWPLEKPYPWLDMPLLAK